MIPPGLRLHKVRKGRGGRVHLTPRDPSDDTVETLCGKRFEPGSYQSVDELEADCQSCLRRQKDPSRISSAFFASGAGEDLLQAALDAARTRKGGPPRPVVLPSLVPDEPDQADQPEEPAASAGAVQPRASEPGAPAQEHAPERLGELDPAGMRRFSDTVFHSPEGVIVRISGRDHHLGELVFDGPVVVRRLSAGRIRITAGDVVVESDVSAVDVRLDRA